MNEFSHIKVCTIFIESKGSVQLSRAIAHETATSLYLNQNPFEAIVSEQSIVTNP